MPLKMPVMAMVPNGPALNVCGGAAVDSGAVMVGVGSGCGVAGAVAGAAAAAALRAPVLQPARKNPPRVPARQREYLTPRSL